MADRPFSTYRGIPILIGILGFWLGIAAPCPADETDLLARRDLRRARVTSLAFSPDSRQLLASYYVPARNRPGTDWQTWAVQWDLETGESVVVPQATSPVAVSDDGKLLAMAIWERSRKPGRRMHPIRRLAVWRFGEAEPVRVLTRGDGHDNEVVSACFAYGFKLVSLNPSGEVILWELRGEKPPVVLGRMDLSGRGVHRPSVSFDSSGMGEVLAVVPESVSAERWSVSARIWTATDAARRVFREKWSWSQPELPAELRWWRRSFSSGSNLSLPATWFPKLSGLDSLADRHRSPFLVDLAAAYAGSYGPLAVGGPGKVFLVDKHGATSRLPFGSSVTALTRDGALLATADNRGVIGLLICFDIHEQAEILRELSVDTLLYSIAWVDESGSDWFAHQLPAVAAKNGFHIVGANWTVAGDPEWHGHGQSLVLHRDGTTLATAGDDAKEKIILADLPLPDRGD